MGVGMGRGWGARYFRISFSSFLKLTLLSGGGSLPSECYGNDLVTLIKCQCFNVYH